MRWIIMQEQTSYEVSLNKIKTDQQEDITILINLDGEIIPAGVIESSQACCNDGSIKLTYSVTLNGNTPEGKKKFKKFLETRRSLKEPTAFVVIEEHSAVLRHDFTEPDKCLLCMTVDEISDKLSGAIEIFIHKIVQEKKPEDLDLEVPDYS